MKSTYKLFGIIYDRLPEAIGNYNILSSYDNDILDISEAKCIFDVDKFIRKINLSFLLSIESKEKLDIILDKVGKLDKIVLFVDLKSSNAIIRTFLDKRIKQILWLFENKCECIDIVE